MSNNNMEDRTLKRLMLLGLAWTLLFTGGAHVVYGGDKGDDDVTVEAEDHGTIVDEIRKRKIRKFNLCWDKCLSTCHFGCNTNSVEIVDGECTFSCLPLVKEDECFPTLICVGDQLMM